MLKVLLKKQLQEFFAGFFVNVKTGKKHTKGSIAGLSVLVVILVLSFSSMFFSMAYLFAPVLDEENPWIYFSVFAVLASLFGILGSVFLTYNSIYEAKDNDFLLSMPVSVKLILLSRMAGLYITTFAFEALVLIPSAIVYFLYVPEYSLGLICILLNFFVLPLFSLSVSCVLGWIIALFASRMRNKSLVTVVISVAFFGVYYYLSMHLNTIINSVIDNSGAVGEWIKSYLYPIYKMSIGCSGDLFSYFVFFVIIFSVFLLVYGILTTNFLKLATSEKGMKKKVYVEKNARVNSSKSALLKKEFLYFKSIPAYMLNCSLGSVLVLLVAVIAVLRRDDLEMILFAMGLDYEYLSSVCFLMICFVASTNNISSVSVSLDAKNLWFIKALPVNVKDVFFSKIMLHIIITVVPACISHIFCAVVFDAGMLNTLLGLIMLFLFISLCALSGLVLNLLFPKLQWTNETIPIKQSLSSFSGMFAGLIYNVLIIAVFFISASLISAAVFFATVIVILLLIDILLIRWLNTKGVSRFNLLSR